jgi:hypothetical protein
MSAAFPTTVVASEQQPGSFRLRALDESFDAIKLRAVDDRADRRGRIGRSSVRQRAAPLDETLDERIVDRIVDDDAVDRNSHLVPL